MSPLDEPFSSNSNSIPRSRNENNINNNRINNSPKLELNINQNQVETIQEDEYTSPPDFNNETISRETSRTQSKIESMEQRLDNIMKRFKHFETS